MLWRTEEGIWSLTSGGRDLTVGPLEEEQVLLTVSHLCSHEALAFFKVGNFHSSHFYYCIQSAVNIVFPFLFISQYFSVLFFVSVMAY